MSEAKTDPEDPERPRWTQLHLWQIQPVRDVLIGIALFALLGLGGQISLVTVPLLLALLLAYLFEPLVQKLTSYRYLNRSLVASGLIFATVFFVFVPIFAAAGFATIQGVNLVGRTVEKIGAVRASCRAPEDEALREALGSGAWLSIRDSLVELSVEPPQDIDLEDEGIAKTYFGIEDRDVADAARIVLDWLADNGALIGSRALATGGDAVQAAIALVGSLGYFVFGAFLTAFFFYFFTTGWASLTEFARGLLPASNRERVVDITAKMDRAIHGFVRGRLTIALVLAVFYSVGFSLMGVPAPLILGPVIALLALIPYAALAGLPVVIGFLWLENHTGFRGELWWVLLAPIVLYNIGQALDDYVLTPVIQGKGTDLDTPTILFASMAGGALMGIYGLLVAIPVAACVKILMKEVFWPRFRAWSEGKERDFLPIDEG